MDSTPSSEDKMKGKRRTRSASAGQTLQDQTARTDVDVTDNSGKAVVKVRTRSAGKTLQEQSAPVTGPEGTAQPKKVPGRKPKSLIIPAELSTVEAANQVKARIAKQEESVPRYEKATSGSILPYIPNDNSVKTLVTANPHVEVDPKKWSVVDVKEFVELNGLSSEGKFLQSRGVSGIQFCVLNKQGLILIMDHRFHAGLWDLVGRLRGLMKQVDAQKVRNMPRIPKKSESNKSCLELQHEMDAQKNKRAELMYKKGTELSLIEPKQPRSKYIPRSSATNAISPTKDGWEGAVPDDNDWESSANNEGVVQSSVPKTVTQDDDWDEPSNKKPAMETVGSATPVTSNTNASFTKDGWGASASSTSKDDDWDAAPLPASANKTDNSADPPESSKIDDDGWEVPPGPVKGKDEWGSTPASSNKNAAWGTAPVSSSLEDDWAAPTSTPKGDGWNSTPQKDDEWTAPARGSYSGGSIGSSWSSDSNNRGRGRGRGGDRGRDRGGGRGGMGRGSRTPQEGDWNCPDDQCKASNFAFRRSCFRCNIPKPGGSGGDRYDGGRGGRGGRGGGYGNGGVSRRAEQSDWSSRSEQNKSGGGFDEWGTGSVSSLPSTSANIDDDWGTVPTKPAQENCVSTDGSFRKRKSCIVDDWDEPDSKKPAMEAVGSAASVMSDTKDDWGAIQSSTSKQDDWDAPPVPSKVNANSGGPSTPVNKTDDWANPPASSKKDDDGWEVPPGAAKGKDEWGSTSSVNKNSAWGTAAASTTLDDDWGAPTSTPKEDGWNSTPQKGDEWTAPAKGSYFGGSTGSSWNSDSNNRGRGRGRGGDRGGRDRGGGRGGMGRSSRTPQEGDWNCPDDQCNASNFAFRRSCFRCNIPKPGGSGGDRYDGGRGGRGGRRGGYGNGGVNRRTDDNNWSSAPQQNKNDGQSDDWGTGSAGTSSLQPSLVTMDDDWGTSPSKPNKNEEWGTAPSKPNKNEEWGTAPSKPNRNEDWGTAPSKPNRNEDWGTAPSKPNMSSNRNDDWGTTPSKPNIASNTNNDWGTAPSKPATASNIYDDWGVSPSTPAISSNRKEDWGTVPRKSANISTNRKDDWDTTLNQPTNYKMLLGKEKLLITAGAYFRKINVKPVEESVVNFGGDTKDKERIMRGGSDHSKECGKEPVCKGNNKCPEINDKIEFEDLKEEMKAKDLKEEMKAKDFKEGIKSVELKLDIKGSEINVGSVNTEKKVESAAAQLNEQMEIDNKNVERMCEHFSGVSENKSVEIKNVNSETKLGMDEDDWE